MKLMSLKTMTLAIAVIFISCSNDKKQTELTNQTVNLKSDILIEKSAVRENGKNAFEEQTLTLSGKTILEATATLKIVNEEGNEVSCVSYPAKQLIHQEYSTANSTLKEVHIREVVETYFEDHNGLAYLE